MSKRKQSRRGKPGVQHDILAQLDGMLPLARRLAAKLTPDARASENLDAIDRLQLRVISEKISKEDGVVELERVKARHKELAALANLSEQLDNQKRNSPSRASQDSSYTSSQRSPDQTLPAAQFYRYEPRNIVGSEPPPSKEKWTPNARIGFYTPTECSEMKDLRRRTAEALNLASPDKTDRVIAELKKRHHDASKHLLDTVMREMRIEPEADINEVLDGILARLTSKAAPLKHEVGTEIPRLFPNYTWDGTNRVAPDTRDLWRKDQYRER